jgi:hypothetical protein
MRQLDCSRGGSAHCQVAKPSPSLFYCRLDDQPDHLVPEYALQARARAHPPERGLVLNPYTWFTHEGGVPPDESIDPSLLEGFALQGDMVWTKDPGSNTMRPFWLGEESGRVMADFRPGDPAPSNLTPEIKQILAMADVLVPKDYDFRRREEWIDWAAALAAPFHEKGYVPVRGLIHPFHIAALRRYYRQRIRTGAFVLGDDQTSRRYVANNERVARFFHHQLTAAVAAIAREPVKPSYMYFASYQGGAMLQKHTDRAQCEFSITLCVDYTPEPRHATPWPIHLQTRQGQVTVFQALGDGLLYRGGELPHFRDVLPEGQTSTSLFFHYVPADFSGSLN